MSNSFLIYRELLVYSIHQSQIESLWERRILLVRHLISLVPNLILKDMCQILTSSLEKLAG
jgi:hypothetical protein